MSKLEKQLKKIQSETYILLIKTQNFHWNVRGPHFQELHTLFESQYNELFLAVDVIAERIRANGFLALGSAKEFLKVSEIKESGVDKNWKEMVKILAKDHLILAKSCHNLIKLANDSDDQGTADLATQRLRDHEKTAWMLNSHL